MGWMPGTNTPALSQALATKCASRSMGKCHCNDVDRWATAEENKPPPKQRANVRNRRTLVTPDSGCPRPTATGGFGLGRICRRLGFGTHKQRWNRADSKGESQKDHKLACRIQSKPSGVGQICQQHKEQGVQPNGARAFLVPQAQLQELVVDVPAVWRERGPSI